MASPNVTVGRVWKYTFAIVVSGRKSPWPLVTMAVCGAVFTAASVSVQHVSSALSVAQCEIVSTFEVHSNVNSIVYTFKLKKATHVMTALWAGVAPPVLSRKCRAKSTHYVPIIR